MVCPILLDDIPVDPDRTNRENTEENPIVSVHC